MVPSPSQETEVRSVSSAKMDAVCLCLLAEDRSITANIDAQGVSKVAKANSNSSNRQKATFIKSLVDTQKALKRSRRNKGDRSTRKSLKQVNTLDFIHPDPEEANHT